MNIVNVPGFRITYNGLQFLALDSELDGYTHPVEFAPFVCGAERVSSQKLVQYRATLLFPGDIA